jgi:hypothetical protein
LVQQYLDQKISKKEKKKNFQTPNGVFTWWVEGEMDIVRLCLWTDYTLAFDTPPASIFLYRFRNCQVVVMANGSGRDGLWTGVENGLGKAKARGCTILLYPVFLCFIRIKPDISFNS